MPRPLAIGSSNGLRGIELAFALQQQGVDTLAALIAGVERIEDDPDDNTVGYGGLPNEDGQVELDAAVMHGPTHRAGAVAGVTATRYVSRLAKLVMEQSNHSFLIGSGADAFARAHGLSEPTLLTEQARRIWLYWRQTRGAKDDWIAPHISTLDPAVIRFFKLDRRVPSVPAGLQPPPSGGFQRTQAVERPTGTVHLACLDGRGDMSVVTSTSGMAFKIAGRVGDSPVIGAGLYVDNAVGTCGSTGRGEANLRACSSFAVVELMRKGASPLEAGLEVMQRIVKQTTEPHLLDADGKPAFGLTLYIMHKSGDYAGISLWGPATFAIADSEGARLLPCTHLFER
jgi:N4-(beta-N-acetylglucosaminyl)-L-asparaginase